MPLFSSVSRKCAVGVVVTLSLMAAVLVGGSLLRADEPKAAPPKNKIQEIVLPKDTISTKKWLSASSKPLETGEIDRLIEAEFKKAGVTPAPRASDEEFIRRGYIDVTGRLPMPADVTEFLADKRTDKRAKLIDRLLDSPEYTEHWARYWTQVITSRVTDPVGLAFSGHFETWMRQQLKKNTGWGEIAQQMITATGELRRDGKGNQNDGAAYLYLSRRGNDAIAERTAETSRIFLGIQIQCAQCHDHPFDEWKREQFHELAAYLARVRERPIRDGQKLVGYKLMSIGFREHRMKDLDNPEKSTVMLPKFLDGERPGGFRLPDQRRRSSLSTSVTSKTNPWFAAAFANRIWGELIGQSFYNPIDDLGPQREAVMPKLVMRLAGSFRGSNYNIKQLYRDILNSDAYQRKIRLGKAVNQHQMFAGLYPNRMNGEALWNSLQCVLGRMDTFGFFRRGKGNNGYRRFGGMKGQFLQEFNFDPSTRPEEVEGTISQALLLMNNPVVNNKIKAGGTNLLGRILRAYPKNEDALRILYLRSLSRRPSENEMSKCLAYIRRVDNRAEAFEDILWVLINSTEFQTKR